MEMPENFDKIVNLVWSKLTGLPEDTFDHPLFQLTAEQVITFFDTAADAQNDELDHAMYHAGGSVLQALIEGSMLPDKYLILWLLELHDRAVVVTDSDIKGLLD